VLISFKLLKNKRKIMMTEAFFWGGIRGGFDPTKEQSEGQMSDFPTGIHQTFHRINPLSLKDNPFLFPKKLRLYVRLQDFYEMKNKKIQESSSLRFRPASGSPLPFFRNHDNDREDPLILKKICRNSRNRAGSALDPLSRYSLQFTFKPRWTSRRSFRIW